MKIHKYDENIVEKEIKNKYGVFSINAESMVHFGSGVLGFPQYKDYALIKLKEGPLEGFILLQSFVEESVTFLVFPLEYENKLITKEDLDIAAKHLNVQGCDAVYLLVISEIDMSAPSVYVNSRAPIVIDHKQQSGQQVVLYNKDYSTRSLIS